MGSGVVTRGYELDMAVCHWQTKLAVWASRRALIKKTTFFSYINILPYLTFFSHNIKHIKHNAMSSSSSSESTSSSDDGAEIFLQTITTVVKAIVEDDEEETSKPKRRRYIAREWHTANNLLVNDYLSLNLSIMKKMFRRRFHMSRNLFLSISRDLEEKYVYFQQKPDVTRQLGFNTWQKVTAALRQLAYDNSSDIMDDCLKMSTHVARESLHNFCSCILELYKKRYLRKPSFNDMQQILDHHADYHGLPGMLGSLDCMKMALGTLSNRMARHSHEWISRDASYHA
ncbi:putative harbinger transposase-derived protein [Helianthus annuus]|nr:putative harbinger transposase-derived protein [Helianthus annuus]